MRIVRRDDVGSNVWLPRRRKRPKMLGNGYVGVTARRVDAAVSEPGGELPQVTGVRAGGVRAHGAQLPGPPTEAMLASSPQFAVSESAGQ